MRHDDLCGQKVRVLNVVDGLAGGLHAQLVGVDVHGGQLRAGDAGEQGVIEGHDGQIFRDAQSQFAAELFQHHGKDVVADQYGGGVVRCGEQGFQRPLVGIVQGVDLHTVLFPRGDAVLEQGHLVAPLALCGKQHGVADPEIRNATVSHFIKVIGGFLPGKGVVIVNVDSLVGGLRRLAHNDMEQSLIAQIRRHRAVLFGVEQDKPICLRVGHHALDGVQHLGIVLPGDDRVHIPPLVAELPDAADDLQMKGVFVDIPLRGGQEIAVNGYFTSVLGAPALNMGVFVGIIAGFVGGVAYNKYYNFRKLPDALAFFNGKRFVPMVVIAYSVVISIVLSLFWPVVQTGINNFGIWIANSSETSPILAPFIYGTLERLLLGIALAMFRRVDADKRANYKSMFISTALAVFLTGVTEPLEFMFMFCAMPLYIVYALLQGCAFAMAGIIHLRLHSFGNLEFITRIPMSLQAGLGGDIINFVICVIAFFVIGYFVAYFMIGKLQLATPGRLGNYTDDNADDSAAAAKTEKKADKKTDNGQAERIIALLGGRENIVLVDACMTRLRVTVKDPAKVADLAAWKAEGALSLLVKGDGIQAVYGPKADVLKSDINDIL
jgi:glucose-like phosphotransferase system IIB component